MATATSQESRQHENSRGSRVALSANLGWLVAACALLLVADGRNTVALAAWLAPVCLLRFVRKEGALRGLAIAYVLLAITRGIAFRGMVPIPGVFYYIFAVISAISALLPYLADRLLARRLGKLSGTLVFPCTLVAAQFLYSHGPQGSWGTVAYTQAGNLPLLQLLSVTGIWGVTFLLGWFAAAVNQALDDRQNLRPLTAFALVYLAVILGGGARLAFFPPSSPSVRVASLSPEEQPQQPAFNHLDAIVAGSATSTQVSAFRNVSTAIVDDLLSRSALEASAGARIIFWSESAVYVLAADEPALLARGRELARTDQVYLGMTLGTWTPGAPKPLQNKLVMLEPDGNIAWQYLKAHPTPGPEAAAALQSDGKLKSIDSPYGRIVAAICYDMDFPSLMAQAGADRADVVISPAGDWRAIDPRHTEMASFRAIEQGFNLARQTNQGLSAAYDYEGHQLAHMDQYQAQQLTMVAQVPIRGVRTLYSLLGNWLAWLCLAGLVALVWTGIRSPVSPQE
jgi:apolipoprotein N-acyltransferase